ncbi:peptide/nickel transport system permease protein [Streptacidiphilus sp. MAP12-16]|uniref:ABC transporter permease n=1 Tax=Streptacidiphilus sp. MAP12-16 TaxID=3156300 RepID=UPI00351179C9
MTRYLIRRLLSAFTIIVVISFITFLIFFAVPSDPAVLACGKTCTPDRILQIRHSLGLDKSILIQYGEYVKGFFAGRTFGDGPLAVKCPAPCMGISFHDDSNVWSTLMGRVPADISLATGAALVFLVTGVGLGIVAAVRKGGLADKAAVGFALFGISLPIYFTALVLQFFFVDKWQLLPAPNYTPITQDPVQWFTGLILPWASLVIGFLAFYTRLTRSTMLETMGEDFVRTARAKGLSQRKVIFKHALRAAITPVVTIFGMDFGYLIGGAAIITESAFGIPGLGLLAVQSVQDSDLPVIMATTLFAATAVVLANVVVDVVYGIIDPRVRLA